MGKYTLVASIATAIVAADQASKWYIDQNMRLYQSIPIIDSVFHITYLRNSGGAFSLFADFPAAVRRPFFLVVSMIAFAALIHFLRTIDSRERLTLFALGGILGGALGNFIDRMTAGEVIDFLDFQWRGYHWPPFNVADSFISTGTVLLLVFTLLPRPADGAGGGEQGEGGHP